METKQPNSEQIPINKRPGEMSEDTDANKPQNKLSGWQILHQWSAISLASVLILFIVIASAVDNLAQKSLSLDISISDNIISVNIDREIICGFTKSAEIYDRWGLYIPTTITSQKWSDLCDFDSVKDEIQLPFPNDEYCKTYAVTASMIAMVVLSMVFALFGVAIELTKIVGYMKDIERIFRLKWIVRYCANISFMLSCLLIFATIITWVFGDTLCHGDDRYLNLDLGSSIYLFIVAGIFGFLSAIFAI